MDPLISIKIDVIDDKFLVSSKTVSNDFKKRHDNVLRDIENIKKDVLNFEEMFIEEKVSDSYGRPQKAYLMNRDGFSLLAMGFTGKEAMEWKVKYIQAFNAMEKAWNTPEQIMARALRVADQAVNSLKERCTFLGGQVVEQQKVIEELQPKASYYDMILQCKDLIATTVIAKDYGMSAKKFNAMLHDMGIQFKQGSTWVLYSDYQGKGYLKTKTHNYADTEGVQHSKEHSYWTQKGRLFLYDFLKQRGILPLIEAA